MNPTHIKVTAPQGKLTPIGQADGRLPGGGSLRVHDGIICRVRYSQDIRRSIARGDLIPCDMNGADVGVHLDDAAAPEDLDVIQRDTRGPARAIAATRTTRRVDVLTESLPHAASTLVPSSKETP